jgi:hypothetical protein
MRPAHGCSSAQQQGEGPAWVVCIDLGPSPWRSLRDRPSLSRSREEGKALTCSDNSGRLPLRG